MPIPRRVKKELEQDEWMTRCCYKHCSSNNVEWHHVFTYQGKQIQEVFNIVPVCKRHHDQATPHKNGYKQEVREYFEWVALQRMNGDMMSKYSKFNDLTTWKIRLNYLARRALEYDW